METGKSLFCLTCQTKQLVAASGSSSLTINWGLCRQQQPTLPQHVLNFPADGLASNVQLTMPVLDEAIDFLQEYASSVIRDAQDEDEENVGYASLQRCVSVFQAVLAGIDPQAFVRTAGEMTGKGHGF